jgi:epoxyqueuosine reductase
MSEEQKVAGSLSRRDFLKIAGVVGVAAQAGGLVAAGMKEGASSETYTGWESYNTGTQFFNRKPFEFDGPAHTPVSEVRRPSHETDYVFGRVGAFSAAFAAYNEANDTPWDVEVNDVSELDLSDAVIDFYGEFPERLAWDYRTFHETIPNNGQDKAIYGNYFLLADAYSAGFSATSSLPRPEAPPEESDFQSISRGRANPLRDPALPFKSEEKATEFIKEMAHKFGATLARITKTNPEWLYDADWRGCPEDYDYTNMPEHWEYAIVLGVPMEWDVIMASPQFSTSGDAYNRVSLAALRLEAMIKFLGYPARANTPNTSYDMLVPPHAIEAGMGEIGRTGFCITPELGGNCRMAMVVTSLPMKIDKPIDFGVANFCNKCKLCATSCPSGAISKADNPDGLVIRGYEHWYINNGACYNYWRETMGPMGCRMCVATCPYSRKDNWVHDLARTLDSRDPTGLVASGLLWMQKTFFDYPEANEYLRPPDGHFESFRPEPSYMKTSDYLDIDITSPHEGE